jgi:hypothetical protein
MVRSTRRSCGAGLAIALTVGALAAPTALAQPTDNHGPDVGSATAVQAQVEQPSSGGNGFDWGDAAIGAGAVLGVAFAGLGGTLAVTRRRQRPLSS